MKSPFPGMDPYIEEPEVWSDFYGGLADEMQAQLNSVLHPPLRCPSDPTRHLRYYRGC